MTSWLIGTRRLANPIRPIVAITEVMPRSSGIRAATNDPRTIIRTMIVSGIDTSPAVLRPPWIAL